MADDALLTGRPARRPVGAFGVRAIARVFDDAPAGERGRIVAIYAGLLVATAVAWALAFAAFSSRPLLLGTALLAYTFGLRHAVDADHISAIDNVTRKLMQEGKRPVGVGLFFSLGHSTIVIGLTIAIALAANAVKTNLPALEGIGGIIGTAVSAIFLFAIATLNALVLVDVYGTFRRVQRGEPYCDRTLDAFLADRGLMGRFFKPLLKLIGSSWQMYPLGVLFGLGFDTATEVGVLGIAALEAGKGLPIYDILVFPLLFTVGMSLLDTTDGILMLGAYGWAFVKPMRKLYYNLNVTLISVLVAVVVGSIEVLGIVQSQFNLGGAFWSAIAGIGENFGLLGFAIVAIFVGSWLVSTVVYRLRGYDDVDVLIVPEPATALNR
jgi:high-affinity nickel-transport protein